MSLLLLLGGSEAVEEPVAGERIAITREYPPDQLAIRVDPPNGAPSRWAADEPLAENVLDDLKYSGEVNGGEKELATTLARDPRVAWPDTPAFADVTAYGPGAGVVWEGRLDKAPESDGDRKSIDPAAVGHRAALEDNKGIVAGFIDGDFSRWGEPSAERKREAGAAKINLNGSAELLPAGGTGPTPSPAAIAHTWSRLDTSAAAPDVAESVYASGGIEIGSVLLDFLDVTGTSTSTSSWINVLVALATGLYSDGYESFTNLEGPEKPQQSFAVAPDRYFLALQDYFNASFGPGDGKWETHWQNIKVLGRHGLQLQGTWPDVGFTAKQMLSWAVPQFSYLEVDEDEMEDDGFVIPQAWFSEPTTLLAIVEELTKYGLLNWFVRGKKFHYRRPGTYGRRWQLYAGPSGLKEQGLDASRLWRSIVVRYQDVDGTTRTIGPPGSGAMVEDSGLEITDPDHPAVRAGITRQDVLDLGGIGVLSQAIATGERWLEEANLLSRSGSCTASYYAMDDRGIPWPVSVIKEGDEARFPDAHDTSYRRVTGREYTHSTRSNSLTLDAPSESIVALLARYGAKLNSLGVG